MELNKRLNLVGAFLDLINNLNLNKDSSIILIGGNNCYLVECLLEKGFKNITILDDSVSEQETKKKGLGKLGSTLNWVTSKLLDYIPDRQFDLWCDCNTFFILKEKEDIDNYIETTKKAVSGFLIISVFSEFGCKKMDGIELKQYGEYDLSNLFKSDFVAFKTIKVDQATSYNLNQNFRVSVLKHKNEQLYL